MKNQLEAEIQRRIEVELGSERDLLLLRNSVGKARYVTDEGKEFFVPYGLGVGSPDLVGLLKVYENGSFAPTATWFCLEVKQPGETPDAAQLKCHAVWRSFGAFVAVVTSPAEARAALVRARSGEAS